MKNNAHGAKGLGTSAPSSVGHGPDSNGGQTDYESAAHSTEGIVNKGDSASKENVLASCLAFLSEKSPDLADVVRAWPKLPEPLRAGILAMVRATKGT